MFRPQSSRRTSLFGRLRRLLGGDRQPEVLPRQRRRALLLSLEELEDRTLLSVTPTLTGQGILDVAFSARGDAATLSVAGRDLRVFDGTATNSFPLARVQGVNAHGTSGDGQAITFQGTVAVPAPVTVSLDTITVAAGAVLSTRQVAPAANPLTARSLGNSSAIRFSGTQITVGTGAEVLAQADSGFTGGDITFATKDQINLTWIPGIQNFNAKVVNAGVDVSDNAVVEGANVTATSFGSTAKILHEDQNLAETTQAIVVADVNGDAHPDLITGNFNQPVRLYLNNGTSTPFQGVIPIDLTGQLPTTSLAVGDVNGDGHPDLVVGLAGQPNELLLNNGTNNPFAGVTPQAIGTEVHNTAAVALADVNGDGYPDLIVANAGDPTKAGHSTEVYLNDGHGHFTTSQPIDTTTYHGSALAVHLNANRVVDYLAVGNAGSGSTAEPLQVYQNDGHGHFTGTTVTGPPAVTAVALTDVNGDGVPDLVAASNGHGTFLYPGRRSNPTAALTFGSSQQLDANPSNLPDVRSIALGDVNNDRKPDLVLGVDDGPSLLYLNSGNSSLPFSPTRATTINSGSDPVTSIALATLDSQDGVVVVAGTDGAGSRYYTRLTTSQPKEVDILPANSLNYFSQQEQSLAVTTPLLSAGPFDVAGLSLVAAGNLASATTHVVVGQNVRITAANQVNLESEALSNAEVSALGLYFGAAFGSSEASSTATVGSGTVINAGGDFNLQAVVDNTLFVSVFTGGLDLNGQLGYATADLAYGHGRSTSDAEIAPGATVTAASASVVAANQNFFRTSIAGISFQVGGHSAFGAAAALGDYHSDATALVNGSLTTTGDANVEATSVNTADWTFAGTSTVNDLTKKVTAIPTKVADKFPSLGAALQKVANTKGVQKIGSALGSKAGQTFQKTLNFGSEDPPVALAAGIDVAITECTVTAGVGPGGRVRAGGNLTLTAPLTDNFQSQASAGSGSAQDVAVGGAVAYGTVNNLASAFLDQNAAVDVGGTFQVTANAIMPNQVSAFDLHAYIPGSPNPDTSTADPQHILDAYSQGSVGSNLANRFKDALGAVLGFLAPGIVLGQVANTFAASSGDATGGAGSVGLAGALDYIDLTNAAHASIGSGARVNQGKRFTTAPNPQNVTVQSTADVEFIDLNTGIPSPLVVLAKAIPGTEEGVGVGGALIVGNYSNDAEAHIDDGAVVSAGNDVSVTSTLFEFDVMAAQAGSKSQELGAQGAIAFMHHVLTSLAYLSNEATVRAGRDLTVTANGKVRAVNLTGGIVEGNNVGVGISASINAVDLTTKAYVGNANGSTGRPGTIAVGRNLDVEAHADEQLVAVAVDATYSPGSRPSLGESEADPLDGVSLSNLFKEEPPPLTSVFGIGIAGDLSFNLVNTDTEAFLSVLASVTTGGNTTVAASNQALLIGGGGAAVIANDAGIGGSFSHNGVFATTLAYVQNVPTVTVGGDLSVTSGSDDLLVGLAAGGAGATLSLTVAGSVNLNYVVNDTEAYLGSGTNATAGNVTVTATNRLLVPSFAGSFSVAAGKDGASVAVGGAIDVGVFDHTEHAYLAAGDKLTATGDVRIFASSQEVLPGIAASFAVAAGESGLGADGSLVVTLLFGDDQAFIGNGARLSTPKSLYVSAGDQAVSTHLAGAGGLGTLGGVGVSGTFDLTQRTVKATIGDHASVTAKGHGGGIADPNGGSFGGNGITLHATASDLDLLFAGAAAVAQAELAVAVPGTFDTQIGDVEASIGKNAIINGSTPAANLDGDAAQSVRVGAAHVTNLLSAAGGLAFTLDTGVLSATVVPHLDYLQKNVEAFIDDSAVVQAQDSVLVEASSQAHVIAASLAAAAGASSVNIAGSLVAETFLTHTRASIGNGATVYAVGNVGVLADSVNQAAATAAATAGGVQNVLSLGGTVGGVVFEPIPGQSATTEAFIGSNAQVTALGLREALAVPTGDKDTLGNNATQQRYGLAVTATAADDAITLAVSAAGGVSTKPLSLAVDGSVVANSITATTVAYIDQGATINGNDANAGGAQDVVVLASSRATLDAAAGAAAVDVPLSTSIEDPSFGVGLGAAANVSVDVIATSASIAAGDVVNAAENVQVQALSNEDLLSFGLTADGSVGLGIGIGLAGTLGAHVIHVNTTAEIGTGATVIAGGSVQVAANDRARTLVGNGALAAGVVSAGAAITALVLIPNVAATVADGARVTGRGRSAALNADDGTFGVNYSAYDQGDPHEVNPTPFVNPGGILPAGLGGSDFLPPSLTEQRSAAPHTVALSGVAVTATSQDEVLRLTVGGSVAVLGYYQLDGSVAVVLPTTSATIGQGALIDVVGDTGAGSAQSVLVAAGYDFANLSVAGTAAVGIGSRGAAADLAVLVNHTTASIGTSAQVQAADSVTVRAQSGEDSLALDAGVGFDAVAVGTVSLLFVNDTTRAFLDQQAEVFAGGNVLVAAEDDTSADILAGALTLGNGSPAALGASLGVDPVLKTTEAFLAPGAVVNAQANEGDTVPVFTNRMAGGGNFSTTTAQGVAVQAASSEHLVSLAVSGAASATNPFSVALSGAAAVQYVDSDTRAYIGDGAQVNQVAGAGSGQGVNVAAVNQTVVKSVIGDGALGGGSLGGALTVAVVRNDTAAYIGNGARVGAAGDVNVFALSEKQDVAYALKVTVGALGIGGSVAVFDLGGALDDAIYHDPNDTSHNTGKDALVANDGSGRTTGGYVDGQTSVNGGAPSPILTYLGSYSQPGQPNQAVAGDTSQAMNAILANVPQGTGTMAQDGSNQPLPANVPGGTAAFIGQGATVTAGGGVDVEANETVSLTVLVGAGSLGVLGGVGGSAGVVLLHSHTQAYLDAGAVLRAGGNVTIVANLEELGTAKGFAGGVGGLVGLGAQAVVVIDSSTQAAYLADGASIPQAAGIIIGSDAGRILDVESLGGALGFAAAGAAGAYVEVNGAGQAYLGDGSSIGQGGTVVQLSLYAEDGNILTAKSLAVAGGLGLALDGAAAIAKVTPTLTAGTGNNVRVATTGNVTIDTQQFTAADTHALGVGVAGGIQVGVSVAQTTVSPDLATSIGGVGTSIHAGNDLQLLALFNRTISGAPDSSERDTAEAMSAGGALIGDGTGARADATVTPTVTTTVAAGDGSGAASVSAGHDLVFQALSNEDAEANAFGLSAALGVGVGVSVANATASPDTEVKLPGASIFPLDTFSAGHDVVIRAGSIDQTSANATAGAAAIVGGATFSQATATTAPTVKVPIGDFVETQAGNDVTLTAVDGGQATATALGVTVAGGVNVEAPQATATVAPDVAATGTNPLIQAGGNITLQASFGYDFDAQAALPNSASASGQAMGGGILLGVSGVNAESTINPTVDAHLGSVADLQAGGNINVQARSDRGSSSTTNGFNLTLFLSFGEADARAYTEGSTAAYLGDRALVQAASLGINAVDNPSASANSTALAGGLLLAANSAVADALVRGTSARAYLGPNARVNTTGAVAITAQTTPHASATANGTTAGTISVGETDSEAATDAGAESYVGSNTTIASGGNVLVQARQAEVYDTGVTQRTAHAAATGSNGSLLYSNVGSKADAETGGTALAHLDDGVQIASGGDTTVAANLNFGALAFSSNENAGLLTQGWSYGLANANNANTQAYTGNGVIVHAGNNFNLLANASATDMRADAHGSADSVFDASHAYSTTAVAYDTLATVGNGDQLSAGATLAVDATTTLPFVYSDANDNIAALVGSVPTAEAKAIVGRGFGLEIGDPSQAADLVRIRDCSGGCFTMPSSTVFQDYAVPTTAAVGSSTLDAPTIQVQAHVQKIDLEGYAFSEADPSFIFNISDVGATTYVTDVSTADVNVANGASLHGTNQVLLSSGHDNLYTRTDAEPTDHSDVFHIQVTATATGNHLTRSSVTVPAGASVDTSDLEVRAETPTATFDLSTHTHANGPGGRTETDYVRGENDDPIRFDAPVTVEPEPATLVVNPDGSVTARNVSYATAPGEVDVTGISGGALGTVNFTAIAPRVTVDDGFRLVGLVPNDSYSYYGFPSVTGTAPIAFAVTPAQVTITNNGPVALRIKDLVPSASQATPTVNLTYGDYLVLNGNLEYFQGTLAITPSLYSVANFLPFTLGTFQRPADITITSIAAFHDVILDGRIANAGGRVTVDDKGFVSNIVSTGAGQVVETAALQLNGEVGSVGGATPINVRLVEASPTAPAVSGGNPPLSLAANAGGDFLAAGSLSLDVQAIGSDTQALNVDLGPITASGAVNLTLDGVGVTPHAWEIATIAGVIQVLPTVQVHGIWAGGSLNLTAQQTSLDLDAPIVALGPAVIETGSGDIRDDNPSAPTITAPSLVLGTSGGVVVTTTKVSALEGYGANFFVTNTGNLTVGGLGGVTGISGALVGLVNYGSLTIAADITSTGPFPQALNVVARNAPGAPGDVVITNGATLHTGINPFDPVTDGFDPVLTVGRNLRIDPGSGIQVTEALYNGGPVVVAVDQGGANLGPSTIDLEGSFTATRPNRFHFEIDGGPENDTVFLRASDPSAGVTIHPGGGTNTVTIGTFAAGGLNPIQGPVTVNGSGGTTSLAVSDLGSGSASSFVVTGSQVTRNGAAPVSYSGVQSLRLDTGGFVNTVVVQSTAAGTPVTLYGDQGSDVITVGNNGSLSGIQGPLTLNGGAGLGPTPPDPVNAIAFDDSGATTAHSYTLSGTRLTRDGIAAINYQGIQQLSLAAGSGNQALTLSNLAGAPPVTLSAGAGSVALSGDTTPGTTGRLALTAGTFVLDGSTLPANVAVLGTATLAGTGKVNGTLSVDSLGTVSPGSATPGALQSGPVTFNGVGSTSHGARGTFHVLVQGPSRTPAPQYSQLLVTGNVNLGGARLAVSTGPGVLSGQSYPVLRVTGGTLSGTFAQGSQVFAPDGTRFDVRYSPTGVVLVAHRLPVVGNFTLSGGEDRDVVFTAAAFTGAYSDADKKPLQNVQVLTLPANGTLKLNGTPVGAGQVVAAANLGRLTFTPNADWTGSATFGWNASDGSDSASAGATVTLNVADAPVLAVAAIVTATEGVGTGTQTVATFTDPAGAEALSDYAATIDWGDGTPGHPDVTPGTVTGPDSRGVFTVGGSHTYVEGGDYPARVTVTHDTATAAVLPLTLHVADSTPVVSLPGGDVTLRNGQSLSRAGSFTDLAPNDTWTATVDYGDGTGSQPLALSGHAFNLSHPYTTLGDHTVTVTVADDEGVSGKGAFVVHDLPPAQVQSVAIDDGSVQRSMVTSLTVTFSTQVDVAPGAFTLTQAYAGKTTDVSALVQVTTAVTSDGRTVATLTFVGGGVVGGSLPDGRYTLTIHAGLVGGDAVSKFFRLFGDANGDGQVNYTDLTAFVAVYHPGTVPAGYLGYFDYNADHVIDSADYSQFQRNYTVRLNADGTTSMVH